ncbi:hypothetical protein FC56_GL000866 [Lentilactobacillus senioris DSM 24302 = JCM 17472]|uniref:Uncharacterized protein n=1 Tax=Lentilactobacillus senioris DSM 24302 = JCM 17472 TaxID=1423802 RepID=A0A0R2CNI2_9LACO|nr:DUF6681 family protein [Lentilactobacillus senioris]KRM93201.1 hypothetical protein FC56_GL000866 [Lentilactobacillus senioris DSM 24302 = JCM 17472]
MFSFLDMVNHYLGYFNINVTVKSRIYTILGLLGDGYLFYVAIRLLKNQYYSRGLLFLALAIGLFYFAIGNLFYYFTNKQFKYDISPWLTRKLHLHPRQPENKQATPVNAGINIPANGLFDQQHLLPAKINTTPTDQENLKSIVAILMQQQLLVPDYQGQDDAQIANLLKHNDGKPVYAIGPGMMLPYFELRHENGKYVIYGGVNQAQVLPLGTIKQIGLQSISAADQLAVDFFLANVVIVGGPYKIKGRSGVFEHQQDYQLAVQVAYQKNEQNEQR